jgi:hypothetical protein
VHVPAATHTATIDLVHCYLADEAWSRRVVPLRTLHELWLFDEREPIGWSDVRAALSRVSRAGLVDEHLVGAHGMLGARRPSLTLGSARSQFRLAVSGAQLRWPAVARLADPVNRVAGALDRHRLLGVYGSDAGGSWHMRARHVRRQFGRVAGVFPTTRHVRT